jgi:two-component system, response regulator PdtaR
MRVRALAPGDDMRVLIVEDEFLIALNLESTLHALGHEVIGFAANYSDAMSMGQRAELALVDIRLSDGISGPKVAETLKAHHGVTVVFTSGTPEHAMECTAAVGIVQKPYIDADIEEAISYAAAVREGNSAPIPGRFIPLPAHRH